MAIIENYGQTNGQLKIVKILITNQLLLFIKMGAEVVIDRDEVASVDSKTL